MLHPECQKLVIAIDGPAASGKGTIGKKLAAHLGFAYLDTGLLYRAAARRVLERRVSPFNKEAVLQEVRTLSLDEANHGDLRTIEISNVTPIVAEIPEVRDVINRLQREFAHRPPKGARGVILDGRDIGTTVFPDADIKLFITAALPARAKRRYREMLERGAKISYQSVHRDLRRRDQQDMTRNTSPLKPAEDAVIVDTTQMSADEAFDHALSIVNTKLSNFPRQVIGPIAYPTFC